MTLTGLRQGLGCRAIDNLLHSSLNLSFRLHKLHNILIFGMAYKVQKLRESTYLLPTQFCRILGKYFDFAIL